MSIGSACSDTGASSLIQLLGQKTSATARTKCPSESQQAQFEKDLEASAEAAGLDISGLSSLKDEIRTAVASAIENYDQSGGEAGLREAVKTAIEDTLTKNGYDPSDVENRLQTAMKSLMSSKGGPGGMQGMGAPPPPPDASGQTQSTGTTDSTDSTDETSLLQKLLDSLKDDSSDQSSSSLLQNSGDSQAASPYDFSNLLADMLFGLDVRA